MQLESHEQAGEEVAETNRYKSGTTVKRVSLMERAFCSKFERSTVLASRPSKSEALGIALASM